MPNAKKIALSLTIDEVRFLASMLEGEKIRIIFADPKAEEVSSELHGDYKLSDSISDKLEPYVFGN